LVVVALGAVTGCTAVSREAYDRDMAGMRQQTEWLEAQKKGAHDDTGQCRGKFATSQEALQACIRVKEAQADELAATRKALDQCTTRSGSGAKELATCQIERDKLQGELSRLQRERDTLHGQLRSQEAELKLQRDRLAKVEEGIRKVRERLQKLVDGGKLRVKIQNGFLVIEVSSDILFDTGKSDIKATAKPVLHELAQALRELSDRRFQIAGHTDNTGTAALNWRLSTARAIAVLEEMVGGGGMSPNHLSAGGYGPYLPVADNGSDEGRKRNRRVEFLLLPDLSELFNLAK